MTNLWAIIRSYEHIYFHALRGETKEMDDHYRQLAIFLRKSML